MEEIKFRAKTVKDGEWLYGYPIMRTDGWYLYTENNLVLIDRDTICQYVGLKDIKGKDIYEDDFIVSHKNDYKCSDGCCIDIDCIWHVEYSRGRFIIYFIDAKLNSKNFKDYERLDLCSFSDIFNVTFRDYEIIGDIYSNP